MCDYRWGWLEGPHLTTPQHRLVPAGSVKPDTITWVTQEGECGIGVTGRGMEVAGRGIMMEYCEVRVGVGVRGRVRARCMVLVQGRGL